MQSFKGRKINQEKPVKVYFNLHTNLWSIMQGGLVVAHTEEITLVDVTTRINESGRQRVLTERKKNVHAFIVGFVTDSNVEPENGLYYNPYKVAQFVDAETMQPVMNASLVKLNPDRTVQYA
jgi:hypothetical protein